MCDEDQVPSTSKSAKMLTAEYKDGQLEIVEVTPYDQKSEKLENIEGELITDEMDNNDGIKYMKVLDSSKNVVVDLLNMALVRTADGQQTYRLVSSEEGGDDTTVTCVISNDDGEDHEGQEESYVVIEGEEGPVVFLQSALQQANQEKPEEPKPPKEVSLSPADILERAKALQKAKALLSAQSTGRRKRSKNDLPPPHELLASPQFKLFLYSCKMCSFKCNAIKELTAHKVAEHSGASGPKWRGGAGGRASNTTLQCARCPYRATTHTQLMKHVKEKHVENSIFNKVYLENAMSLEADVLVCGACGFETGDRDQFKRHIASEHGVR